MAGAEVETMVGDFDAVLEMSVAAEATGIAVDTSGLEGRGETRGDSDGVLGI